MVLSLQLKKVLQAWSTSQNLVVKKNFDQHLNSARATSLRSRSSMPRSKRWHSHSPKPTKNNFKKYYLQKTPNREFFVLTIFQFHHPVVHAEYHQDYLKVNLCLRHF